jgi:hypothetical protein
MFPRKPISANIPDLPDLHIRKWSLPELFELQELTQKDGGGNGRFSLEVTRRILALSLSDANGNRIVPDGREAETDGLGSDVGALLTLAFRHNGMGPDAKNG